MTCCLIPSLLSFRVAENFPKLDLNKSRIKNKNTQIKTGQGIMVDDQIKGSGVPNAENISLQLFQIKFLQLSCSNLKKEGLYC